MIVFLRNVPQDVSLDEITEFLSPQVKGGIFRQSGEVLSVSLLKITPSNSQAVECHAIAHIKPDSVALRVIGKLHAQMFRGRRIALHEYAVRNWRNDRRTAPAGRQGEVKIERRVLPTRRRKVSIEVEPLE